MVLPLCGPEIVVAQGHGSFQKQLDPPAHLRRKTRTRIRTRRRRGRRKSMGSAGAFLSSSYSSCQSDICTNLSVIRPPPHRGNAILCHKQCGDVVLRQQIRSTFSVPDGKKEEEKDDDEMKGKRKRDVKDDEEGDELMGRGEVIKLILSSHNDGMDALEHGRFTHALAIKNAVVHDIGVSNALITMYGKYGHIHDARIIFEKASGHTVISWTAMIHAYSHHGHHSEALRLFREMESQAIIKPNEVTFATILRSCAAIPALADGHSIHLSTVENGFEYDVFVGTSLIDMYGKCGSLEEARFMFDRMVKRNLATWNSMITAYAQQHQYAWHALEVFTMMLLEGVRPDRITFISLLSACALVGSLRDGYVIHEHVAQDEIEKDVMVGTSLVDMYGKCGALEEARSTFEDMCERTVVSWNALIGAYSSNKHGEEEEVLHLFVEMQHEGVMPDEVTFINMFHACENALKGRELHASITNNTSIMLETALVCMYGKIGNLDDARRVFDNMCSRDLVCWTAMIMAYVEKGENRNALRLFRLLKKENIKPDVVSFVGVLTACANLTSLDDGRETHALVAESGLESELFILNSLLNMYGKCGSLDDADIIFQKTEQRNLVTWNAIIAAYAQRGNAKETLRLFRHMQKEMIAPDQVTFVSVLSACIHEALLEEGLDCFKTMVIDFRILPSIEHYGCMIDLFGRFGKLAEAEDLIFSMPIVPDAQVWNTFLGACKAHGDGIRGLFAMKHATNMEPKDAAPYIYLSNMYAEGGRLDVSGPNKVLAKM